MEHEAKEKEEEEKEEERRSRRRKRSLPTPSFIQPCTHASFQGQCKTTGEGKEKTRGVGDLIPPTGDRESSGKRDGRDIYPAQNMRRIMHRTHQRSARL